MWDSSSPRHHHGKSIPPDSLLVLTLVFSAQYQHSSSSPVFQKNFVCGYAGVPFRPLYLANTQMMGAVNSMVSNRPSALPLRHSRRSRSKIQPSCLVPTSNTWRRSQAICTCSSCELKAIKRKMKLQQQEIVALQESHSQPMHKMQDKEETRDKELAIVLRKVNRHTEQIRSLGKDKHGSRPEIHGQYEAVPSEGPHASCEVLQPLNPPPALSNQDDPQAIVDTKLKLH